MHNGKNGCGTSLIDADTASSGGGMIDGPDTGGGGGGGLIDGSDITTTGSVYGDSSSA